MQAEVTSAIRAEAVAWRIRLADGLTQDWDAFTDWLALDSRHSLAYDQVALGDRELDQALGDWPRAAPALANDNVANGEPVAWRRRWVLGVMAAAAALALVVVPPALRSRPDFYDVSTAPGEQRVVTLGGHDRIALNGDTSIRLDRNNPRFASLGRGEAAFALVHDPDAPFVVQLGGSRVQDVGTAFNVIVGPAGHTIEVAEGALLYNPDGERISLGAGQTLTRKTADRRITVSHRPAAEVGGWQHGRLSYSSSPLTTVAADLSRNLGTTISLAPGIANRSFTGTIEIDRNEDRMFARLARLLDVEARRVPGGWTFGPARKAAD